MNIGEGMGSSHGILEKAQGVQRSAHSVGFIVGPSQLILPLAIMSTAGRCFTRVMPTM